MLILAAHEIRSLGQAVTGTVDTDYVADWLVNGDPDYPVRISGGSASLTIALAAGQVDGVVVANHNLIAGTTVALSGIGSLVAPTVPPGDIRRNMALRLGTPIAAPGSTDLTISGHATDIVLGDVYVGLWREVWPLPTGTQLPQEGVQIRAEGDYHRLSSSRGAQGLAPFGGTIYVHDADYQTLQDAYDASRENSLPTVVVLIDDATFARSDPLVVTWETWAPAPICEDLWAVDVSWRQLPAYRWAA